MMTRSTVSPAQEHEALPNRDQKLPSDVPIIDNGENSLDLRPSVNRLETMIRQRLAANPGQPVVVMMGESHSMPTHVALQQMLMSRLIDPENNPLRIALGVEWPHNIVDEVLGEPKFDRAPIPSDVRNYIADGNDDARFFRTYQTVLAQHRGTLTHRNFLAWAEKNNISTRPVDAAWEPDYTVDRNDPLTHKITIADNPDLIDRPVVPLGSPEAEARYMRIRNLVIRDRVQAHLEATDAQVYFLPYGRSHLLGSKSTEGVSLNSPFKDSLVGLFAASDMKMELQALPVFVTYPDRGAEILLPEAHEALKQGLVVDGLSPRKFMYETPIESGMKFPDEERFLREIYKQSGVSEIKMPVYADEGTRTSFGYGPNHNHHIEQQQQQQQQRQHLPTEGDRARQTQWQADQQQRPSARRVKKDYSVLHEATETADLSRVMPDNAEPAHSPAAGLSVVGAVNPSRPKRTTVKGISAAPT